jgi:hypothetical protein
LNSRILSFDKQEGNRIQVICELTERGKTANNLTITTPLTDFEREVIVEASPDSVNWTPLARENIFDYSRFIDFRKTTIKLPETDSRFLRVQINRAIEESGSRFLEISRMSGKAESQIKEEHKNIRTRAFRFDQIMFHGDKEEVKSQGHETIDYPVFDREITDDSENQQTIVEWSAKRIPITRVAVDTPARNFRRQAVLKGKPGPDAEWQILKRVELFHYGLDDFRKVNLTIPLKENRMERYQLIIENGDSEAIPIDDITNRGFVYRAIWLGSSGQSYSAYFGSAKATREANRDVNALKAIKDEGFPIHRAEWDGEIVKNPGFAGPEVQIFSFLERKEFLWGVIGLAVAILVVVLFQTGKRIQDIPETE